MALDAAELAKALEIAGGSKEGAKYLCIQVDKKIYALKIEKLNNPELVTAVKQMQEQVRAFAKYVSCQLDSDPQIWPGRAAAITTAFEKLQANLATEGVKAIEVNAKENEFTMHLAIGNEGEILRAYTAEGVVTKSQNENQNSDESRATIKGG